jgi:hypothetical protein
LEDDRVPVVFDTLPVILPIPEILFIVSKNYRADTRCDPRPKQEKKRVTNENFSVKKRIVTRRTGISE